MCDYFEAPGEIISKNALEIIKTKEIVNTLEQLPYVHFLECRESKIAEHKIETIVFDAEIEVGQKTVYDIKRNERIAIVFLSEDVFYPQILALRKNFPIVPHLYLRSNEAPQSICLSEQDYDEFKLSYTPILFIESIREWLAKTADNNLHAKDQPLEPLLDGSNLTNLIIPHDLFKSNNDEIELLIISKTKYGEKITLVADRIKSVESMDYNELEFVAIPIKCAPQPHGIIHKPPGNLSELHKFLLEAKVDLLSQLRELLLKIKDKKSTKRNITDSHLILIVYLPKTRQKPDVSEALDIWAFCLEKNIKEVGVRLGIWGVTDTGIGILLPPYVTKEVDKINVELCNPMPSFSRELAFKANKLPEVDKKNIVLIGGGALGSQILMNLVRMGIGNWTIIDKDRLLPHNLARHTLPGFFVGCSKAEILAKTANSIITSEQIAKDIIADVLHPLESAKELNQSYKDAQFIIDISTSIPVARHIVRDIDSSARRISVFLNPSGSDVVILAEDENRDIRLDYLEMQYYRYLINEPKLKEHLQKVGDQVRYARSCSDISNTIPQDLVALHSAICSRGIYNIISKPTASIQIWQAEPNNMSVQNYNICPVNIIEKKYGGWTLCADQLFFEKVFEARENKLPNETGGVLIGSFDTQRKIIYIVDTILSPPDSTEWPASYIRGCRGLKRQVEEINRRTANMLYFVGEWHSHPRGCSTGLSMDDSKILAWLENIMSVDGKPALVLIVGDSSQYSWHIKE